MRPDKTKEYQYWFIPSKNKFIKPIDIVINDYGDEYFKYKQNGKEKYFLKAESPVLKCRIGRCMAIDAPGQYSFQIQCLQSLS